jgi:tetratricopeptide (TPR) repeat protein
VTAELTSTADGHVLWTSEPFESRSGDVFQVQDEFTRAVLTALTPKLRGDTGSTAAKFGRGTDDARAYDLYLHGRYFWARRGVTNLNRAIDFFRRAVAVDTGFARAHAGLAMAYAVLPFFDATVASDSTMEPAVREAERALALDPANADAHLALANIYSRQFRQADARSQFLAALADAPFDATAHAWYGDYLERTGRGDSALVEKQRALDLEPLSALFTNHLAQTLYLLHRMPEAITAAHRAPELDSTFTRAYFTIARIQLFRGFPDSALAAIDLATRFGPRFRGLRGLRVLALAAADRWPEARSLRATIVADRDLRGSDGDRMIAALAFGNHAEAMQALERTIASHELQTVAGHPGCDPLLQPLLADPQFVATIRRLGTAVCAADLRWPVTTTPP